MHCRSINNPMKSLLTIALLALALTAQAQTTTNLAIRVQVESITGGTTNTTSTNWRLDYGNKNDALRVDGFNFAYASYAAALPTNQVAVAPGVFFKQNLVKPLLDNYAQQKQAADNAVLLQKLTSLLTVNSDQLTAGDLTSLNTIAAKAP